MIDPFAQRTEPTSDEVQQALSGLPFPPADERFVRFYLREKRNEQKSLEAGRPIYEMVEYVEIHSAGDHGNIVDRPVRHFPLGWDRYFWPQKYAAFKAGQSQDTVGTPLGYIGLNPGRIAELSHFKIRSVEDLAAVSDGNIQGLGMGARNEREKARDYLQTMKGNAPVVQLRAENDALRSEMDALKAQMAELAAMKSNPKK